MNYKILLFTYKMEDKSNAKRKSDIKKLMKEVREYEDVPISVDSSEIYEVKNKDNGLSYFGHAQSYQSMGANKPKSLFGGIRRSNRHMNCALGDEKSKSYNDCPIFYPAIREHGQKAWRTTVHLIVPTDEAKAWETKFIEAHQSYKSKYGYNVLAGTFKPESGINKQKIEDRIDKSNRKRAVGGKLHRSEEGKKLPANVTIIKNKNKEIIGFHARMKIRGKTYATAFRSAEYTLKQKLLLAKKQREEYQMFYDDEDYDYKKYTYSDLESLESDTDSSDNSGDDSDNNT
jgi:hypothetical protein